ncbi:MAG: FKBP-type peptidyl-prolyl cis-trans isomerase [Bacteroidota bacterium]
MKVFVKILFLIVAGGIIFACDQGIDYEKLRRQELELLDEYINTNYPGAEPTASGLYYFEEIAGTGDTIKPGDRVQIFYATWTLDSVLVDQSNGYLEGHRYEPLEYVVGSGGTVKGLEEASAYMQKGTKAHLVINSELAYGQQGNPPVPGFATLLMEVEVYKVYPFEIPETE